MTERRGAAGWDEGPHLDRSRGNGLIRERLAVVGDPHRSIDPFFHLHLGRPDVVADLIELPVVGYGPIAAQDARGFEAATPVQVAARGTGPMEIGRLRRRDGKAPVVDR